MEEKRIKKEKKERLNGGANDGGWRREVRNGVGFGLGWWCSIGGCLVHGGGKKNM